jgi:hypothetical protein
MLSTFIVQLVIRYYKGIEIPIVQDYELLVRFRGWMCEDLFSVWMNLLYHSRNTATTYIISDVDQCIELRNWFLKKLVDTTDGWDAPFKFVVTSIGDEQGIREALSSVLSINLDSSPRDDTNRSSARCELPDTADNNPLLPYRQVLVQKILAQCGAGEDLQRLVIDWLEASNGTPSVYRKLEKLTSEPIITVDEVIGAILSLISLDLQCLVRHAIVWVSTSFHPLTKSEFEIALALEDLQDRQEGLLRDAVRNIKASSGIPHFLLGLLVLVDNEVRFSHLPAPELYIGAKAISGYHWCHFKEQSAAHAEIARSCIFYLSLPEIQQRRAEFYERGNQDEPLLVDAEEHGLLAYAVMYWTRHYKQAKISQALSKQVADFLMDNDARGCWAEMYHILSNQVTRGNKPFSSPLEVVSAAGLEDLVVYFLNENEMKEEYSTALGAAARNGHIEITQKLLRDLPTIDDSIAQDVILAAASSADQSSVIKLIDQISGRTPENFTWQPDILTSSLELHGSSGILW